MHIYCLSSCRVIGLTFVLASTISIIFCFYILQLQWSKQLSFIWSEQSNGCYPCSPHAMSLSPPIRSCNQHPSSFLSPPLLASSHLCPNLILKIARENMIYANTCDKNICIKCPCIPHMNIIFMKSIYSNN
jgi:hypothetical protein